MFCLLPWLCVEKATVTYSWAWNVWALNERYRPQSRTLWMSLACQGQELVITSLSPLLAWVSWNPLTEKISSPTRPGTMSGRITKCKNPHPIWPIIFHLWEHLHRPKGKIVSKCFLLTNIVLMPQTLQVYKSTPPKKQGHNNTIYDLWSIVDKTFNKIKGRRASKKPFD